MVGLLLLFLLSPVGPSRRSDPNNGFSDRCLHFASELSAFNHHVYHAFHHVLSTKKPQIPPIFRKTPPKNHHRKKRANDPPEDEPPAAPAAPPSESAPAPPRGHREPDDK